LCALSTCTGGIRGDGVLTAPKVHRGPGETVHKCGWTETKGCQCWCTNPNDSD
jgi:hypothetical protein